MAEHVTCICHTEGCANEGVPITMPGGVEMDGEWVPMDSYACGVCYQPITDVVDQPAPEQVPS